MARIVQNFDTVERNVMAFLYRDGSATIEVSYSAPDGENVTLFNKIEFSPEGVKKLLEVLERADELRNEAVGAVADESRMIYHCPKCEYPRSRYDNFVQECPNCGAPAMELDKP
jgi:rubrerythrin